VHAFVRMCVLASARVKNTREKCGLCEFDNKSQTFSGAYNKYAPVYKVFSLRLLTLFLAAKNEHVNSKLNAINSHGTLLLVATCEAQQLVYLKSMLFSFQL